MLVTQPHPTGLKRSLICLGRRLSVYLVMGLLYKNDDLSLAGSFAPT